MKIGVLTYNCNHLKTQQVLKFLLKKKRYDITLLITKKKLLKKKITKINHRPYQFVGKSYKELIRKYNLKSVNFENKDSYRQLKYILICGSGIIDKKKIIKNKFINCHAGLIPQSRGLDAIKWSLYNNHPVGNTIHFIDSEVDKGKIIHQEITKCNKKLSLAQFYKNHYLKEIELITEFEFYLKNGKKIKKLNENKANMRFPKEKNYILEKKFKDYKKNFNEICKVYEK